MFETINGYPVIATYLTAARGCILPGRIIIVDRGREHEERYVVAWQGFHDSHGPQWDSSWGESCYCETLKQAHKVFFKRIKRETEG